MTDSNGELWDPVLGEPRRYTSREVADAIGVPMHRARRFWRGLGFANVDPSAVEFTASDITALRILTGLISDGTVDEGQAVHFMRLLGRIMSRIAGAQVELVRDRLEQTRNTNIDDGLAPEQSSRIVADVEWLLGYAWRRHIGAAMGRLHSHADRDASTVLGVGFADMVGFTELSSRTSDAELTHVIERFEGRAADIVAMHRGSVVKMLGDELLFVANDATTIADIAIQLLEVFQSDREIPGVRIGVTMGPVVRHLGDVFGTTVNLASRLTATAAPNTILTSDELATTLITQAGYELHRLGPRELRGIGRRMVFRLDRRTS